MTLSIPAYLKTTNIQDSTIRYLWDDWNLDLAEEPVDEDLVTRLKAVSQRAILAFACGSGEWMVYRFARLNDDPAPWNFLEAAWAMMIDARYSGYGTGTGWQEHSGTGWEGPVKGPIRRALELLESSIQQVAWHGHTDPPGYSGFLAVNAGMISALICHVMTDAAPYRSWCGQVLQRIESIYPYNPNDPLGDVIPRQAVDPNYDFQVEQTEALIRQFLSSLNYRSNIFLSSPEGMLASYEGEEDFKGTPYDFDLAADRQARRTRKTEHHDE
jgi:hypothetical protein